jgi:hypothetical protein
MQSYGTRAIGDEPLIRRVGDWRQLQYGSHGVVHWLSEAGAPRSAGCRRSSRYNTEARIFCCTIFANNEF